MGFRLERPASPHPAPNSQLGAALRDEFIAAVYKICGDVRLLWLPKNTDGATATDASRYAATVTYDAAKTTADYKRRGSAWAMTFDGTADEGDTPDNDRYSFGDGAADQPFSVFALCAVTADAATDNILAKWDGTSAGSAEKREWRLYIDASENFYFSLYDESANTYIGGYYGTALASATWALIGATYDGSASQLGIALYKDGTEVALTSASSGTYVAMEDLSTLPTLGANIGTAGSTTNFFKGDIAFVVLCARALSQDEAWAMKAAVNKYFDLTL